MYLCYLPGGGGTFGFTHRIEEPRRELPSLQGRAWHLAEREVPDGQQLGTNCPRCCRPFALLIIS